MESFETLKGLVREATKLKFDARELNNKFVIKLSQFLVIKPFGFISSIPANTNWRYGAKLILRSCFVFVGINSLQFRLMLLQTLTINLQNIMFVGKIDCKKPTNL